MLKSGANSTHPQAAVPYGNKADPYSAALRSSAAQNAGGKGNAANQNHAGDKNNTGAPKKKVGDVLFDTIQSWHSRKLGRKEFGIVLIPLFFFPMHFYFVYSSSTIVFVDNISRFHLANN